MENNELSRLHNFLEMERTAPMEGHDSVMITSISTPLNVNYSVTSLTEVFNSSSLHESSKKQPTPPPRLKKQMRQEKSKVFEIASRFENIQLQYQNGCKITLNEEPYETEDTETSDRISLNTPCLDGKNESTVFRFKDAYTSLPRPKTEGKLAPRAPIKYNSYHPDDVPDSSTDPPLQTEDIQYRPKELIPKEVKPIIDELIKTEETYVENLRIGLQNYEPIFDRLDLPPGLRGKKFVLMGNVEQLLEFHETQFLPMLRRERQDITRLFIEFARFLDEHYFYSYVIYTMNKKRSLQLCDIHKDYFKHIQGELGDKLGECV